MRIKGSRGDVMLSEHHASVHVKEKKEQETTDRGACTVRPDRPASNGFDTKVRKEK